MESLKPGKNIGWIAFFAFFSGEYAWSGATKISSIEFIGNKSPNRIEVRADGPLNFEKQVNEADKQIIIEVKNAILTRMAARKIDTSSFNSPVLLISPYSVENQPDTVRIVLQLRESTDVTVTNAPNGLAIQIAGAASSAATGPVSESDTHVSRKAMDLDNEAVSKVPRAKKNADDLEDSTQANTISSSDERTTTQKKMDQFLANTETRNFTGRRITLQARDMEIGDVFRLISEASGFNIILSSEVTGKVTLSLADVPWDQALSVVLKTQGLAGERTGSILRILPLAKLTTEKEGEEKVSIARAAITPRVTRIFPISYANLDDLKKIISALIGLEMRGGSNVSTAPGVPAGMPAGAASSGGGDAGAGGEGALGSRTRTIVSDSRTNSLIIKDVPENMDKIAKLIEILDVQTPQVLIEAKIVEASEGFSKSLGGSIGSANIPESSFLSFNGGNPTDSLFGGVFATGADFAKGAIGGGGLGLSFIHGARRLNALINMGENESTLKVVASPRAVVSNKQKANVVQTTPVAVPVTTSTPNGVITAYTMLSAQLSLDVTPTVTNDGSVRMELTLNKDIPADAGGGQTGVANRNIKTDVVVDSGSTLVLGGFYTVTNRTSGTGFPFLRKLPLIGALFGSESSSTDRTELFFFITPQIIDPKKAGFGT